MCRALLCLGLMLLPPLGRPARNLPPNFGELLPPRIEEKLQLDPDQKDQLAGLRREFKAKCLDIHDQTEAEVEKIRAAAKKAGTENARATKRQEANQMLEMMKHFDKLRAEYEPRLRALLTDEQRKQFDALRREKPPPAPPKGGQKKGDADRSP
jgi:Spy/CpxP family protein refolding chaperone